MLKFLSSCAAVCVLVGSSYGAYAFWPEELPSAAIKIETPSGLGSGTHIGNGVILTAAHVVKNLKTVKIKNDIGQIVDAQVLWTNDEYDLAALSSEVNADSLELNCDVVPVGTSFAMKGNPLGMEFVTSYGRISAKPDKRLAWASAYVVDATFIMGNSGGAAVSEGEVIGVVVGLPLITLKGVNDTPIPGISGFGFIVPSSTVCKFFAKS